MNTLSLQLELCPALPNVYGALDYREFRDTLVKIDKILVKSAFEHKLTTDDLSQYIKNNNIDADKFYNSSVFVAANQTQPNRSPHWNF